MITGGNQEEERVSLDHLRGMISEVVTGAIAPLSARLDAIEARLAGDHADSPDDGEAA